MGTQYPMSQMAPHGLVHRQVHLPITQVTQRIIYFLVNGTTGMLLMTQEDYVQQDGT